MLRFLAAGREMPLSLLLLLLLTYLLLKFICRIYLPVAKLCAVVVDYLFFYKVREPYMHKMVKVKLHRDYQMLLRSCVVLLVASFDGIKNELAHSFSPS